MLALDAQAYDHRDAVGTVRALDEWWMFLLAGFGSLDDPPPWAETPVNEYRSAVAATAERLGLRVASPGGIVGVQSGEGWLDAVRPLLAAALGALHDAATARRVARARGRAATAGRVAHLASGDGGVPKQAVPEVVVTERGVSGDRQRNRQYHGRPWQALCLWSLETIDELRAAGHPIGPGDAGENITVADLQWEHVVPGVQLRIGEVLVEASLYAAPCRHNARWFADGDIGAMSHERGADRSRMYGSVVEPGRIRLGDPVELIG